MIIRIYTQVFLPLFYILVKKRRLTFREKRTLKFLKTKYFEKVQIPKKGHAVEQLVEALRYKPEASEFDSRLRNWIF
jgi:hypothetical protein